MRASLTLSTYIGRQFMIGIGIALFALAMLILLFDAVELTRRAAGRPDVGLTVVVKMALAHLPYLTQRVIPYAILVGVMLALARLTRTHELVVVRAAGVSVWQFLFPGLALAFAIGLFVTTIFNPIASALLAQFEQLDAKYLRGQVTNLAVSSSGLWLRQSNPTGESVIHASRISQPGLVLHDVIILNFANRDEFVGRIDADQAALQNGRWMLTNALVTGPERLGERRETLYFETNLTINQIQDSFASPETMSFWQLPAFIALLERAGFSSLKHRVHLYTVLAEPALHVGMVLIAAAFSLRMTRRGGVGLLMALGIGLGFLIYVFSDVVLALGLSANLPALLAGVAPAALTIVTGAALLLYLEDS